jgi:hypothetical protein
MAGRILILFLTLQTLLMSSQQSVLVIESPDSIAFILSIDGRLVSDSATYSTSTNVFAGSLLLDFRTSESQPRDLSTSIEIAPAQKNIQHLTAVGDRITLIPFATSPIQIDPKEPLEESNMVAVDSITHVVDSFHVDHGGCFPPVKTAQFEALLSTLSTEPFESGRQKILLKQTSHLCLRTEQVIELLDLFEMEDRKLALVPDLYSCTYNQDSFDRVGETFVMSSNQERFHKLLMELRNQP